MKIEIKSDVIFSQYNPTDQKLIEKYSKLLNDDSITIADELLMHLLQFKYKD